jgi:hypothetical protein
MFKHLKIALVLALLGHSILASAKNVVPTVSLTSPAAGQSFAPPATITLSANANDTDGTITKVDFYRGSTLIGTATTAPYTITWSNVAAGSYSLTAKATDNAAGVGTSTAVAISVAAPKVAFTNLVSGGLYEGTVYASGTYVGDPASTSVWVDNGKSSRLAELSGNTFSARLDMLPGPNTIKVSVVRADKTYDNASINVTGWQSPAVALTMPVTETFNMPVNVILEAQAVSPLGTISKVEFRRDGNLLGTVTAPPYQYTWTNAPKGQFRITATAHDNASYTGMAQTYINVLGPNVPPTISIAAPLNGSNYTAPANILITTNAADSDGSIAQVEFLGDEAVLGASNIAPFQLNWNLVPVGTHTIRARATDNTGAQTMSAPASVTVTNPNSLPSVSLTAPQSNAQFAAGSDITIQAAAADSDGTIARVDFYIGNSLLGTTGTAPYQFVWKGASPGAYSLTARAFDDTGAMTASQAVAITVLAPPPISILSPATNTSVTAPGPVTVSIKAASQAGTVTSISLYDGATLLTTVVPDVAYNAVEFNYSWNNISPGDHTLIARVTDSLNVTSESAVVNVRVLNPPALNFITGGTFFIGPAYIDLFSHVVPATGTTISKVEYFNNGVLFATRNGAPFNFTWGNVPVGNYLVTSKVTDNLGTSKLSQAVAISVGTAPSISPDPALADRSVADDRLLLSGTFQAPLNSAVDINGVVATVTKDGKFFVNGFVLNPGSNTVTFTVTTQDGLKASKAINVTSTGKKAFTFSPVSPFGIEKLRASFMLTARENVPFTQIEIRCAADGPVSISGTELEPVGLGQCGYESPGLRTARITILDGSVVVFDETATFYVASTSEIARTLSGVYTGMLGRLKDNSIPLALSAIADTSKQRYEELFTSLGTDLSAAATNLGDIGQMQISPEYAELAISRIVDGEPRAFLINVMYCHDGIWRIESM